ncbi:zinc metalloendopeptidase, M23 family [Geotalea daltonii FRC-32]|uniref:Zinc metalloendopeptidase, M23 family n=1 Tax=Geotalea daltonii (strain DSM 22248 / JCM 15807 / FRC-32) TaxID=316067 RepID=B9M2Z3_GEODF|nr:M23 family metallopeptidase [Geotalea daltonii]ACM21339.1 zinc metalloendopeptidase, M23 family [Geotalea daltonii FRC-32]
MLLSPWKSPVFTILLLVVSVNAHADFYRFEMEDGVEVFTNTPTRSGAVKIMKEDAPQRPSEKKKFALKKTLHENRKSSTNDQESLQLQVPVTGKISSNYGWRHDPIDGNLRHHSGIDIAVGSGTPVKSIAPGKVTFSGPRGGYGNLVIIEHDSGMTSLYGHNSLLLVVTGEQVDVQTTIALSGSTGRSTGPHLHFELWKHGTNLTQAYVEDRQGSFKNATIAANRIQHAEIRRFVEKNGTIVFTNLPQ